MANYYHLLTQTITLQRCVGVDDYGDPIYAVAEEIPAAVSSGYTQLRDADGNERISSHAVVTAVLIDIRDRVWLPGENPNDNSDGHTPVTIRSDITRTSGMPLYQTFL